MYEMDGFEKRIHSLRKAKGLSQEELAARLGVTAQAVSKWEKGQSYPDITLMPNISAILDVSIDDLFGRTRGDESYSFPARHEGLPLVHSYQNIACYSDKAVASADGSGITFTDGSTAELSSQLVRNTGKGEIKLLCHSVGPPDGDNAEKTAKYEFPYADSLDIEVAHGKCLITQSSDGKTGVDVRGSGRFVRHHKVSAADGTLKIWYDSNDREPPPGRDNLIQIALPCDKGKRARLTLNGGGGINVPFEFEDGALCVNGSGGIRIGRLGGCAVSINGSGGIHFDGADTAGLTINGSGSIDTGDVGKLAVQINGSGDIKAERAGSLRAQVNGSGDIELGEIRGGNISFEANGSGDLTVRQGNCDMFEIKLMGSGGVDAKNVTARTAGIVIEFGGSVTLGRVLEGSSEQIKKLGTITILHRGAE